MSALMLACRRLVGAGDHVVAVTPLWPNLVEIPKILGAHVTTVPLTMTPQGLHARRRSPPRGAAARHARRARQLAQQPDRLDDRSRVAGGDPRALRRHGIWVIADDVYERLHYVGDASVAPSFLAIAHADDRLISTNTFSKSWCMTGWRLGWMVAPAALMPDMGTLIEYNTSCSPAFVQRAGHLRDRAGRAVRGGVSRPACGGARAASSRGCARCRAWRSRRPPARCTRSSASKGSMTAWPSARASCARLASGLAPGRAFGREGEGFVRWCFASDAARLDAGSRACAIS
jgi:aspartate/methionine/tyrosine aminotransferase